MENVTLCFFAFLGFLLAVVVIVRPDKPKNDFDKLGGNLNFKNEATLVKVNASDGRPEQMPKKNDEVIKYTVFFCWQSDIEGQKESIEEAINTQATNLSCSDYTINVDKDTDGVAGMQSITRAILEKIENCDIFICDLTPVIFLDINGKRKAMPNSNVMFELGYAMNCLAPDRIIGIVNTDGEIRNKGEMPLDIIDRKLIEFSLKENNLCSLLKTPIENSLKYIKDLGSK